MIAEAIGHALSAADYERAARLIEKGIPGAFAPRRVPDRAPLAGGVAHRSEAPAGPGCSRARCGPDAHRPSRRRRAAPERGRAGGARPTAKQDRRFLLGYAAAVRSWRARLRGDAPGAVELARQALSLLPDEDVRPAQLRGLRLGFALRTPGTWRRPTKPSRRP